MGKLIQIVHVGVRRIAKLSWKRPQAEVSVRFGQSAKSRVEDTNEVCGEGSNDGKQGGK